MKKKILSMGLCAALTASLFAGCGANGGTAHQQRQLKHRENLHGDWEVLGQLQGVQLSTVREL